jgi:uncharacterized protein YukE
MPKAIADPEEIRNFAHVLLDSVNRLRSLRADVMGRFNELHDHWQDEKYMRFREVFTTAMSKLEAFLQQGEDYVQYLHRKAQLLDEYLKHRY